MSAPRVRSLRLQLAGAFLLVGIVPAILVGAVAITATLGALREQVTARNQALARAIAGEADRYLEAHLIHLREVVLAASWRGRAGLAGDAGLLAAHLEVNPAIRSILLLDRNDRVARAAPPAPDLVGIDFSGQPFVREARRTGVPTWSSATISLATGLPGVTLMVPGSPWSAVGFLDLDALRRISERSSAGGITAIVDRDGTFIAHRDPRLVLQQVNVRDLDLVARALAGEERTGGFRFEGREWLASAVPVPATRWVVLAMEPASDAFGAVERLRALLFVSVGAAVLLALAAGYLSARRILQAVEALAASTRRLAAGEPPAPVPAGAAAIREFDELGRLFDAMGAAVRAREKALARSERSYRRIVDAPMIAVVRVSVDGTILFANAAMARINRLDDPALLVGRNVAPFYARPEERGALLAELMAAGRISNRELRFRTLPGEERIMLANVVRDEDGITTVLVDVTESRRAADEKERMEQQLLHSQKMEAVGRLAGGVAHDFNNLLTAIIGYASALQDDLPPGDAGHEAVDGILAASDRAAHLTRSLLAYSRKQVLTRRPVDLRDVLRDAARLIGRVLGEDVRLALELPDERLPVLADPGQLDQVLMNLCTNARDAMPGGGRLTLTADPVVLDAVAARSRELVAGGAFARLRVRDTGVGMTPELLERAFEPFFTTKPTGRGTGLGLAIVQGIVRQHDGAAFVESAPGSGTTVTILLPIAGEDRGPPARAAEGAASGPRGTETVLLAEDEPQVRRVMRSILARGGYQVIEAGDGRDAVEAFAAHRDRIALCILDVVMPELNGKEAYDAIRQLDPAARVLFASGYAADVLEERTRGADAPEIVKKPVSPAELLRTVREAIDRR